MTLTPREQKRKEREQRLLKEATLGVGADAEEAEVKAEEEVVTKEDVADEDKVEILGIVEQTTGEKNLFPLRPDSLQRNQKVLSCVMPAANHTLGTACCAIIQTPTQIQTFHGPSPNTGRSTDKESHR
jgi:hypothetical protein